MPLPDRPHLPVGPPAAVPAAPGIPASPGYPAGVGYRQVGDLTAERLLTESADTLRHLDPKIVQVREWLQTHLSKQGMSDRIAEARMNPAKRAEMTAELDRLLIQYMSKETVARGEDRNTVMAAVINEVLGLGPIEPLWRDPQITEVMVNGPGDVYVEREGRIIPAPGARFRDRDHLLEVCQQILMPLNRRVDQKSPLADGRLGDGSRVNIVHYTVAPGGPLLTIRRFPEQVWTLIDLVENGSVTEGMACELAWLVKNRASLVVIGGTGAGKTSTLNALSSCIPRDERVITVEDSLELRLHPQSHVAAMEARPSSASGEGEVRIRDLVKNALRMRPDRIVVGEVRDASAVDMLSAMNTGHEGSLTTVHANGADEAIQRLASLVAQGGEIPDSRVGWLIGSAVDVMVVQRRYEDGSRRIAGIYEVPTMRESPDGEITPIPLWEWEHTSTEETGRFIGEYRKVNDLSERMIRAKRLAHAPKLTIEDVRKMSELPTHLQRGR